jgi:DNA-binding PadR family transcriptional regulator
MIGPLEEAVTAILCKGEATTGDLDKALAKKYKKVATGALYNTLDRLIGKNYVERRLGAPQAKRGGKARFYYKVTEGGRKAMIEAHYKRQALISIDELTGVTDI